MRVPRLLLAAATALLSTDALACSCLVPEDWSIEQAREAGAVFAEISHAGERIQPMPGGLDLRLYTAAVHRAIGLKPGGMISIVTPATAERCGVGLEPGETRWLLLHQQPEGWGADLCSQLPLSSIAPEEWDRYAGQRPGPARQSAPLGQGGAD